MRIGILTFHWAQNYGALLQAYALKSKLEQLGHDVVFINRIPKYKGLVRKLYHKFSYKYHFSWIKFEKFAKDYIFPKTRVYTDTEGLKRHFPEEHFDAVVVGSDQVWRWGMMGYNYFFDFVDEKTKKVSYAASFGLSEWSGKELNTETVKKWLHRFDMVSVREKSGVDICKNIFDIEASLVLDPTLLHDGAFYEETILKNYPRQNNSKVVSYILGKNYKHQSTQLSKWSKEQGMAHSELFWTSVELPSLKHSDFHFSHITLAEWLNEIRNAEYVVTNSFHCTVFSILFGKQFVVLENKQGGNNRIETLLSLLGIENRLINDLSNIKEVLNKPIDYNLVNTKLQENRELSLKFLYNI